MFENDWGVIYILKCDDQFDFHNHHRINGGLDEQIGYAHRKPMGHFHSEVGGLVVQGFTYLALFVDFLDHDYYPTTSLLSGHVASAQLLPIP